MRRASSFGRLQHIIFWLPFSSKAAAAAGRVGVAKEFAVRSASSAADGAASAGGAAAASIPVVGMMTRSSDRCQYHHHRRIQADVATSKFAGLAAVADTLPGYRGVIIPSRSPGHITQFARRFLFLHRHLLLFFVFLLGLPPRLPPCLRTIYRKCCSVPDCTARRGIPLGGFVFREEWSLTNR